MTNYMLDTNICIYSIKNKPANVLQQLYTHSKDNLCISSITLGELYHGVCKSDAFDKNQNALIQFLALVNILPWESHAALEYGRICAYLQKKGKIIGTMDMLIAAHAKAKDMILVTNNTREFERVPDLKLENWAT